VKRNLSSLAGWIVAALFVWLLTRQVDIGDISTAAARLGPQTIGMALISLAIGYTFRIARWWWLLRALDPSAAFRTCWAPYLTSIALNNILPFRAGDAVRVVGFRRELRAPAMRILGTMFVERLLDLLTLLCLFFLCLPRDSARFPAWLGIWATVGAVAASTVLCAFFFLAPTIKELLQSIVDRAGLARRPIVAKAYVHVSTLIDSVAILRSARLTVQLIALSFLAWFFEGGVYFVIATRLGVAPSLLAPWFSLSTGTLATLLPSSPGYVGTFDYFAATGLLVYGVARDQASAFAVILHLMLWVPLTVAGGVCFLRYRTLNLSRPVVPNLVTD
jgi:glycosyltransferase 2 family protein